MNRKVNQARHQQIKELLIRRFQECPLDTRLPSDRQLAQELGAAYLTVNRVMKELAWEGYVERRPRKGTFLASRERLVLPDVETGVPDSSRGAVVFAWPNYSSHAFWRRLRLAEEQALKRGLGLIEFKMNRETTYEGLRDFVKGREGVRGVLLMPVPASINRRVYDLLEDLDLPVVILEPCGFVPEGRSVLSVTADWFRIGYAQAQVLIEHGHRRIGLVPNEPEAPERMLQLDGVRQALADHGLPPRALQSPGKRIRPWMDSREAGYELTRLAVGCEDRPTALLVDSISGSQGALRALWEQGISVPQEMSLITMGPGDGSENYMMPALTTVDEDVDQEIAMAFDAILSAGAAVTKTQTTRVHVRHRESVAALPAASGDMAEAVMLRAENSSR